MFTTVQSMTPRLPVYLMDLEDSDGDGLTDEYWALLPDPTIGRAKSDAESRIQP